MNTKALKERFHEAGLDAIIRTKPLRASAAEIFQLDIKRSTKGNRRNEIFRIWPGVDNEAIVTGVDKDHKQLVLCVKEQKRMVEVYNVYPKGGDRKVMEGVMGESRERMLELAARRSEGPFETHPKQIKVGGAKMHYLLGLDERQLFIANLRKGCSSVTQAHKELGASVSFADGKARGQIKRQGEWFFVNLTDKEMKDLKKALKEAPYILQKNRPIENQGNPHMVSESAVVDDVLINRLGLSSLRSSNGFPLRSGLFFARGKVTHKDHAPLKIGAWRMVVRNQEGATSTGRAPGVYWID